MWIENMGKVYTQRSIVSQFIMWKNVEKKTFLWANSLLTSSRWYINRCFFIAYGFLLAKYLYLSLLSCAKTLLTSIQLTYIFIDIRGKLLVQKSDFSFFRLHVDAVAIELNAIFSFTETRKKFFHTKLKQLNGMSTTL